MDLNELPISLAELLDQAAAASRLGDREEAERLYRRASERSPANTRAWLGLAGAVESIEEKQDCFERVLALDPGNGEARTALKKLAERVNGEQAAAIQAALNAAPKAIPFAAGNGANNKTAGKTDGSRHGADALLAPWRLQQPGYSTGKTGEVLYCANHPSVETTLRCNRCGKPVCVNCVGLTEVGYRCKECIREQQNVFFNAANTDYVILSLVSFLLALVAAPIIGVVLRFFGFFGWILAFFLGPSVGGAAATIIRRSIGQRRGRYMGAIAAVAIILGTIIGVFVGMAFGFFPNLLALGIFVVLALGTILATLR